MILGLKDNKPDFKTTKGLRFQLISWNALLPGNCCVKEYRNSVWEKEQLKTSETPSLHNKFSKAVNFLNFLSLFVGYKDKFLTREKEQAGSKSSPQKLVQG